MRLQISRSKNAASFYVTKSVYNKGKRTSKIVEKLGTYEELLKRLNGKDPIEWANEYVEELNRLEKEGREPVVIAKYSPSKVIEKDEQRSFNGGYLFLQQIYHELKLNKLCAEISKKYKFTFDLNSILSRLLYSRIIYPSSKLATFQLSSRFIEQPNFELQHIYRA
ncbi:MAG: transposase, partial [Clostridiaceae bacterium]|nr:transposase [Clostridiaceae bacterium]